MNSAQECMPVKTVSVRSNDAAWMTNEIRALIKQRGKIHKKAKRSNSKKDWDNFRAFRNDVISKIRKRKIEYFDKRTEKISNPERFGNKDWWKFVHSIPPISFTLYKLSRKALKTMYKSFTLPLFDYADIIFVMTKCVRQHKIVKGGKLQKSKSSLICVTIAEGSTNALPVSTSIPAHFCIPVYLYNKNVLLRCLINDIL